MPRSSSSFTSEASLKRGGGSVKCCSGSSDFSVSFCPASSGGSLCLSSSSSSSLTVLGLFVDLEEAVELQHRSGDSEPENFGAGPGINVDRSLVEDGRVHLRSDEALPDQLVNLEFVFLQILFNLVRVACRRGRDESPRARPALLSSPYRCWENRANKRRQTAR